MGDQRRRETNHPDIIQYPNGIYYARLTIEGCRKEVSLKTKNFADASRKYKQMLRDIELEKKETDDLRVEDVFDAFMKAKNKLVKNGERRQRTIDQYEAVFGKHLYPFFKFKKITEITTEVWEAYCDEKEKYALVNHRKLLSNFLRWCTDKEQRYITGIPRLPVPRRKPAPGKALTNEQVMAILSNVRSQKLMAFCLMYLYMAMRSREITALAWSRVHFDKQVIFLGEDDTKTKSARWVPMHSEVLELLTELKQKSKSPYVFPKRGNPKEPMTDTGIYKSFRTAKIKSGVDYEISPHDFRHTWTTEAHNDPSLTDAQREDFAGSRTITQKETYVHNKVERLRPLAEIVKIDGVTDLLEKKRNQWGKLRGKNHAAK